MASCSDFTQSAGRIRFKLTMLTVSSQQSAYIPAPNIPAIYGQNTN